MLLAVVPLAGCRGARSAQPASPVTPTTPAEPAPSVTPNSCEGLRLANWRILTVSGEACFTSSALPVLRAFGAWPREVSRASSTKEEAVCGGDAVGAARAQAPSTSCGLRVRLSDQC